MVIKKLLQKLKRKKEYPNRFVKFYHLNKKRLDKERKSIYHDKRTKGICVRCNKKAVTKRIFCNYHRTLQKGYNKKARDKT